MRKSKILLSMCLALILSLFQNSFAQSNDLVLSIDGKQINFSHENKPFLSKKVDIYHGDRVSYVYMVPLKVVYEHLGATVSWNNDSSTIDVLLNGNRINFKVGSKDFVINGKTLGSNEKVLIKNDKAFVDIVAVKLTSNYYLDFSQDQTVANLYDQNISIVIDRVKVSLNTYNETPDVPYLSYNINDQGFNVTNISNVSILARDIFEALGASVKWNNIERSTTINLKDDVIKLMVDTNEIYLNGIKSDYPTYLSFGKTKIRLGFLIDELNYHARWVQADKTIYLDKK